MPEQAPLATFARDLFRGRTALVTGGGRGIGRAIALGFAEEGARVLIADIDEAQAEAVIAEGPPQRIVQRRTDVTNADEVNAMVEHAIATLGAVDVLVNCAGWTVDRLFLEKPRAEWEREIAIDMWGFINATQAVLEHMIERGSGRIVNISSIIGQTGNIGQANYAAAKSGMFGLTTTMAREAAQALAKQEKLHENGLNVTVNAVAPGFIETEMLDGVPEKVIESVKKRIPFARLGRPEEIARVVHFLCADASSYITGQVWAVNGGMDM